MKLITKKILYKEWALQWLAHKEYYIKESTFANYSNVVYNHLIPDLGDTALQDITHNLLQQYILDKLKSGRVGEEGGLSEKSVKDIMMVLKNSLKFAMNQGLMDQINLDFTYPKSQHKTKIYILSKKEQKKNNRLCSREFNTQKCRNFNFFIFWNENRGNLCIKMVRY